MKVKELRVRLENVAENAEVWFQTVKEFTKAAQTVQEVEEEQGDGCVWLLGGSVGTDTTSPVVDVKESAKRDIGVGLGDGGPS